MTQLIKGTVYLGMGKKPLQKCRTERVMDTYIWVDLVSKVHIFYGTFV